MSALPNDQQLRARFPNAPESFFKRNAAVLGAEPKATALAAGGPLCGQTPASTKQAARRAQGGAGCAVESETRIQQAVMKWWALKWRAFGVGDERLLMAFPLQGKRTPANAARMKAEGMRCGTPDMFLAVPMSVSPFAVADGMHHGLWIELKTAKGRAVESQLEMHALLSEQGYAVKLCRGYEETTAAIVEYLKLPDGI